MSRKMLWVSLTMFVAGLVLARIAFHKEFTMPENFPVLDANEIATENGTRSPPNSSELATFGSGCFWCTEAVFQQLKGVTKVVSGYSGGSVKNPSYEQICTGTTGHAEVVQITFDPAVITYPELLEVFWRSHDPTTRNRQGNDVGPQYRSVIFTHSEQQRKAR
ncbi:MAG: peptide-methionine (S)-S-oxide reductase MsrA [Gemmataceae bacterium]